MSSTFEFRNDRPSFAGAGIAGPERAQRTRGGERDFISRAVRQMVYQRDGWTCQHCGSTPHATDPHRRSGELHLDHIVPWSAGGSDRSDNLRTLCRACNIARSNFVDASDEPAMPIVRICTPCLAHSVPKVAGWCELGRPRLEVYCATHRHISWALDGWHII